MKNSKVQVVSFLNSWVFFLSAVRGELCGLPRLLGNSRIRRGVLLQVPDLVAAVQPLVKELVGIGKVQPLGYLYRVPVFELNQIAEVAEALQENERSVKDADSKEKSR